MSIIFKREDGSTVEFRKYNHYHAADGRFASKGGGTGGVSTSGRKSPKSTGPNGGAVPEGKDPYEYRSRNVDKKNRAKFDVLDEVVSEGMSTGSKKADKFINQKFNSFCRTGEDQDLNDAAMKLYEFTGDSRLR